MDDGSDTVTMILSSRRRRTARRRRRNRRNILYTHPNYQKGECLHDRGWIQTEDVKKGNGGGNKQKRTPPQQRLPLHLITKKRRMQTRMKRRKPRRNGKHERIRAEAVVFVCSDLTASDVRLRNGWSLMPKKKPAPKKVVPKK